MSLFFLSHEIKIDARLFINVSHNLHPLLYTPTIPEIIILICDIRCIMYKPKLNKYINTYIIKKKIVQNIYQSKIHLKKLVFQQMFKCLLIIVSNK